MTEWGLRWPDDPDAVEEYPSEHHARAAANAYRCAQLVHRQPGPWIPVHDTPADSPPPPRTEPE